MATASMNSNNRIVKVGNNNISYNIDSNILQVILSPQRSLTYDVNCLNFYTDGVTVNDKSSLLAKVLSMPLSLSEIKNTSAIPKSIGFCQSNGNGNILPIDITTNTKKLYIVREYFICCSDSIEITPKLLPLKFNGYLVGYPQSLSTCHYAEVKSHLQNQVNIDEVVFLQGYGSIMKKTLLPGEALIINTNALAAFDTTISMSLTSSTTGSSLVAIHGLFYRCEGPGVVYFCPHSLKRTILSYGANKMKNMSILGFLLHVLLCVLFFYSLSTMINQLSDLTDLLKNDALNVP